MIIPDFEVRAMLYMCLFVGVIPLDNLFVTGTVAVAVFVDHVIYLQKLWTRKQISVSTINQVSVFMAPIAIVLSNDLSYLATLPPQMLILLGGFGFVLMSIDVEIQNWIIENRDNYIVNPSSEYISEPTITTVSDSPLDIQEIVSETKLSFEWNAESIVLVIPDEQVGLMFKLYQNKSDFLESYSGGETPINSLGLNCRECGNEFQGPVELGGWYSYSRDNLMFGSISDLNPLLCKDCRESITERLIECTETEVINTEDVVAEYI